MFLRRFFGSLAATLLLALSAGGQTPPAQQQQGAAGINTTLVASGRSILPFEPVGLVLTLRNETAERKRVMAAWRVSVGVGAVGANGVVKWGPYIAHNEPVTKPPARSPKNFEPNEAKVMFAHLDYMAPSGRHVFASPGRYRVKASAALDPGFISNEVEISVVEPQGRDAKAYEFLKKSDIHRYFSERTVAKYPRTSRNVRALESFIAEYDGSAYANLARLGLALMWMQGVNERIDLFKARESLTQVARKATGTVAARAHYYLGVTWKTQGHAARAREEFQAALGGDLDPYLRALAEQALK